MRIQTGYFHIAFKIVWSKKMELQWLDFEETMWFNYKSPIYDFKFYEPAHKYKVKL